MNTTRSPGRWSGRGLLAVVLLLSVVGCSAGETRPVGVVRKNVPPPPPPPPVNGLTVTPAEAWVETLHTAAFTASAAPVTWSLSGTGDVGSITSITGGGLYRAPGAPTTLYVVANDGGGRSGRATVHVVTTTGTHGLAIPASHPRLWFTPSNLAAARAWYAGSPFTPAAGYELETALHGLLAGNAASCQEAIASALIATTTTIAKSGTACDYCRWLGERVIATYDWCYAYMTDQQRSDFITNTNAWVNFWRTAPWGAPPGHHGNYYWGYLRNELEWAIASYHENTALGVCAPDRTCPEVFLEDVFTVRLANDFYPASLPGGNAAGGVGQEGSAYGPYLGGYVQLPFTAAAALGRDVFAESNFWRENVYWIIYDTSPSLTYRPSGTSMCYTLFPFSDDTSWNDGCQFNIRGDTWLGNTMRGAAIRWASRRVGQHARRWLIDTGSASDRYVAALDPGGASTALASLPLDYYAPGAMYAFVRSSWGPQATSIFLQLGDPVGRAGHPHIDWGTFQIWRGGRYVSRETVGYGDPIVGYQGTGTVNSAYSALAHNAVLFGAYGTQKDYADSTANAVVQRLESQPGYFYAAVDLSRTNLTEGHTFDARWSNPELGVWVREVVFVRELETLVLLDRLETVTPSTTRTFINHCGVAFSIAGQTSTCTFGGQSLVTTTAWPAGATIRSVSEDAGPYSGGFQPQFRLEVDTAPGTAQSYMIHVLQAKDAATAALTPSVTDGGTSFTVTLDGTHAVTFQKGMTSTGGSVTLPAGSTSLRTGVQTITVSDAGPAWSP